MNKWGMAVLVVSGMLLVGCEEKETVIPKKGVATSEWLTTLEQKDDTRFVYTIENTSKVAVDFTFSSGMQVDYTLSKEGEKMYTQSEVISFTQAIEDLHLVPSESKHYEIFLEDLDAGNYELAVWFTANETKEQDRKTHLFTVQ